MGLLENTIGAMIGRRMGSDDGQDMAPSGGSSPYAPLATALVAMLAAKAATGGFGDLGSLLGGGKQPQASVPPSGGPLPLQPHTEAQGGIGGLLTGLGGLLNYFQQNGQGGLAQSWVNPGQNAPASPAQITQGLGPDTIRELASRLGMSEAEVSARLSKELPHVVDKLTPQGRMPTYDEASAWN